MLLEEAHRRHEQIVEVERLQAIQPLLIHEVQLGGSLFHPVIGLQRVLLGGEQLILRAADPGQDCARVQGALGQAMRSQAVPHEAQLIAVVIDDEGALDA